MTTISATVIRDSVSPAGIRLTTMHLRYPRFIHAELMTHRVFSRNARSSRAVPVETMLKEIENDPVVPLHWGANQKGMQADKECDALVYTPHIMEHLQPRDAWLQARDRAVEAARHFSDAGYHKQVVNRLIEPFMHIDVLVSATEWANFLALRDHHMAEPHIAMLAREVRAATNESKPKFLQPGEWHLPYITGNDLEETWKLFGRTVDGVRMVTDAQEQALVKISVARCARISYRPFDGSGSIEAEIARHDALVGAAPMHASPAEHQATPDHVIGHDAYGDSPIWKAPTQHGNLRGWRQYRKTLSGENQAEAA